MDAAQSHYTKVDQLLKLDSRNNHNNLTKVREAELKVRSERATIGQHSANLSLSEIITIVRASRPIWPNAADFLRVRDPPKKQPFKKEKDH